MISLLAQYASSSSGNEIDPAVAGGIIVVILLVAVVVGLIIGAIMSALIYVPYKKLPAEHQQMSPGMVFLLMVPILNIVWAFIISNKIPASYQSYFDSIGDQSQGDCGKNISMWWAICIIASIIPFVGGIAGLASLVLYILFVVKLFGMSGKIPQQDGMIV